MEAWQTAKENVESVVMPFANDLPALIFLRKVNESHSLRLADEEIEDSEEEDDHFSS